MSYRYRAYPDPAQVEGLAGHCGHARYVWNLACEQQGWYAPGGARRCRPPGAAVRMRQLAEARQAFDWQPVVPPGFAPGRPSVGAMPQPVAHGLVVVAQRLLLHAARPGRQFCVRDVAVRRLSRRRAEVWVPKVGWLRFRLSRPLPVSTGMARVTLDRAGRWHLSFTTAQPPLARVPTGSMVGLDRGVAVTVTTSYGQHLRAPHNDKADRAARRLAARMARQQRGSRRRVHTRAALARLHVRVADRRKDCVEKTSTRLVRAHDVIVLEELRVADMVRRPAPTPDPDRPGVVLPNQAAAKTGLNRSIHRSCWGLLARRVADKAVASGVSVVTVNPAHSSTECRVCGHRQPENRESQAVFRCLACRHVEHADTHAAQIILARGLAALRPPQDMGQDSYGSARGNPERSVARTTRSPAPA